MRLPCERNVKYVLPAIRAMIAYQLFHKHSFNQQEIAKKLGITQPAVSQYLRGLRGRYKPIFENKQVMEKIDELVNKIASERIGEEELANEICEICKKIKV